MGKIRTHYDNLQVSRFASPEVIRAAYRQLTQLHHPDRHGGDPEKARIMRIINASYDVLSDPTRRREHDEWISRKEAASRTSSAPPPSAPPPPPPPSPPYQQSPPATPAYTPPPRTQSVTSRAWFPWAVVAAIGVGSWLMYEFEPDPAVWGGNQDAAMDAAADASAAAAEASMAADAAAAAGGSAADPAADAAAQAAAAADAAAAAATAAARTAPPRSRLDTAPNGMPWPYTAGYLPGYSIGATGGHSNLTIDNSQNNTPMHIKLYQGGVPVRQIYLPGFANFTMESLSPGYYDLRYRDLTDGGLTKSESFTVTETATYDGSVQYSDMTVTLYKVANGNFSTHGISESEF